MAVLAIPATAQEGPPSDQDIQRWIQGLDDTAGTLPPVGVSIPRELTAAYHRREKYLKALSGSPKGLAALVEYCLAHHRGTHLEPDLQWVAMAACAGLNRELPDVDRSNIVSLEQLRSLLLLIPASPKLMCHVVDHLDLEDLLALDDVWTSWLDHAPPELLSAGIGRAPAGYLFVDAVTALRNSFNPVGIERTVTTLRGTSVGAYRLHGLEYLSAMGDPRAFDLVIEEQGGPQCGTPGRWYEVPYLADQSQMEDLLRCRSFDLSTVSTVFRRRPDLARAVVDVLRDDGGLAKHVGGFTASTGGRIPLSQVASVLRTGIGAIPVTELVSLSRSTLSNHDVKAATFWLDLLGRKPEAQGIPVLIGVVDEHTPSKPEGSPVLTPGYSSVLPSVAARGLLRHVLSPKTMEAVIDALQDLPEEGRRRVAGAMARAIDSAIGIPLKDPRRQVTCGGGSRWDWSRWKPAPSRRKQSWLTFVRNHQEGLLPWLCWVDDTDLLARIYPFMTGRTARQRFLQLLEQGEPMAAQAVWRLRLELPRSELRAALAAAKDPTSRAFLLLRLAEENDDHAYREIKNLVLPTFPTRRGELFRFQTPVLDEAVRRRDITFLKKVRERFPAQQRPRAPVVPLPYESHLTGRNSISAYLIRVSGALARNVLRELDPASADQRLVLLEIVASAGTPNGEVLLRAVEPHLEIPANLSGRKCKENAECWRWITALSSVGTAWCRDRLVQHEAWRSLLNLGDSRATEGGQFFFETGMLDAAIEQVMARRAKKIHVPFRFPVGMWDDRGYPSIANQETDIRHSVKILAARWKALSLRHRSAALELLQRYPESVTNDLLRAMAADTYGPVRLTALEFIWRFRRPGLERRLLEITRSDPLPWCRRLAREILRRPVDPLASYPAPSFEIYHGAVPINVRRQIPWAHLTTGRGLTHSAPTPTAAPTPMQR